MLQELSRDIFLIDIPLPRNPLKNLNSYFIRGGERNLLIDTGFNNDICYEALMSGLEFLGAGLDNTDVFLTHLHADHSGLSARVKTEGNQVYMGYKDLERLRAVLRGAAWNAEALLPHGFSEEEVRLNLEQNPGAIYNTASTQGITPVEDGAEFEVGRYCLRAIETPGHTPGHMCLYDEGRRVLFCGDHLLYGITPNITSWNGVGNSLGDYLDSLQTVLKLNVDYAFAAHRKPLGDHRARIARLTKHHRARLEEALRVVQREPGLTAYQVASRMSWAIRAKSWGDFPVSQRVFATGEAASHLDYLIAAGHVARRVEDGVGAYFVTGGSEPGVKHAV